MGGGWGAERGQEAGASLAWGGLQLGNRGLSKFSLSGRPLWSPGATGQRAGGHSDDVLSDVLALPGEGGAGKGVFPGLAAPAAQQLFVPRGQGAPLKLQGVACVNTLGLS